MAYVKRLRIKIILVEKWVISFSSLNSFYYFIGFYDYVFFKIN